MKGLNAFIHEQAALGKSAKEIAQLAHDAKWPHVKLLSKGIHSESEEECLELAASIRLVFD